MSTRYYPLYQKGGPQLRVFLPNFWLKLIKPTHDQPPNVVQFSCSMEMTRHDVKNYLEKIYNVETVDVRIRTELGKMKKDTVKGYITKQDDVKLAYVTLPKNEKFVFPDLFPEEEEKKEKEKKVLEQTKETHKKFLEKTKHRPDIPGWFAA